MEMSPWEAGTNLLLYSEQLENAAWLSPQTGTTSTADAVAAPDGTTTAEQIDFATTTSYKYQSITMPTGMAGGDFTFSIWLYSPTKATIALAIRPQPSNVPSASLTVNLTTGWVKYSRTVPSLSTDTSIIVGLDNRAGGNGGDGIAGTLYAWGGQLTQGDNFIPYVKTVASQVYNNLFVNAQVKSNIYPATDLAYSLGYQTLRFNGNFGNTTSTNVTTTKLFATNSTITYATTTNLTITNINSNLIPLSNDSFNIGSSALSWHSIFASSTVHAGGVTSTGNINPFANGLYDIGISGTAWKSIFASSTIHAGGVTSTGNVNPFANNTYNLGSGSLVLEECLCKRHPVIGGALSATGDALSPAKSSFLDIGSETARWNRIHAAEIYLNGGFVMAYEANILASSTRQLSLGLSYAQDSGIVVRELALTGSTYGGASTLSLIESPTSTLKVTNGSSGWGSIQAQNVTANGSVTSSYLEFTSASGSSLLLQLTHSRKSIRLSRQRHELSCGRDRRHQLDV